MILILILVSLLKTLINRFSSPVSLFQFWFYLFIKEHKWFWNIPDELRDWPQRCEKQSVLDFSHIWPSHSSSHVSNSRPRAFTATSWHFPRSLQRIWQRIEGICLVAAYCGAISAAAENEAKNAERNEAWKIKLPFVISFDHVVPNFTHTIFKVLVLFMR